MFQKFFDIKGKNSTYQLEMLVFSENNDLVDSVTGTLGFLNTFLPTLHLSTLNFSDIN